MLSVIVLFMVIVILVILLVVIIVFFLVVAVVIVKEFSWDFCELPVAWGAAGVIQNQLTAPEDRL